MLAFYLHNLSPFIWEIRPGFGLRWYGFAYVLAFLCGYWLYRRLAERGYSELAPNKVGDFITGAAIFGVLIGGRLGYCLFYRFDDFIAHPLDFFKVWDGGMASHGGMLGLILFTLFYARKHKLSWTSIGDSLCVVAPVGLFFGRMANFINGELYGRITRVSWAVQFPKELYDNAELTDQVRERLGTNLPAEAIVDLARSDSHGQQILRDLLPARHPSQLYEAFLEGIVLFSALWILRTKLRVPRGVITGAFFVLYALLRMLGEQFREPDAPLTGFLTRGQFLSLFLILIGTAFIIYGLRAQRYERAQIKAP